MRSPRPLLSPDVLNRLKERGALKLFDVSSNEADVLPSSYTYLERYPSAYVRVRYGGRGKQVRFYWLWIINTLDDAQRCPENADGAFTGAHAANTRHFARSVGE